MKKTLTFLALFCWAFTVFIGNAYAKPKSKLQFRKEMLWHIAALPAYAFLQLNVHEGSHALTALAVEAKVVGYKPYPHAYTFNGEHYFAWGSTLMTNIKSEKRLIMITLAPYLADINIFIAADLLISLGAAPPHSVFGGILYFIGMVMPLVDFAVNVNGFSENNDFSRLSQLTGVHRAVYCVAGNAMAAVAIWRLLSVGKKVFFKKKAPKKSFNVYFAPMPEANGVSVTAIF